MSFCKKDGFLFCEDLRVKDIQQRVATSPFYLYSLAQMSENYSSYATAVHDIDAIVAYSFKANGNLFLLKHLRALGSGAVLVSENELRLASAAGFDPARTIFNGNGKTSGELELAVDQSVMVNIDSDFDLTHIEGAAEKIDKDVRVLLRVNPDIDPVVHPYVSTGLRSSKFGVDDSRISWFLDRIRASPRLKLVGIHGHLGSTIQDVGVFGDLARVMMETIERCRRDGFDVDYLNIGGGLGVNYERRSEFPSPRDLVEAVRDVVAKDVTLIIEPGRSIVGSAGVLVGCVIGAKSNGDRNFLVVDASMTELIRPSLYDAYHEIGFVEPVQGKARMYDVVGPVCESADFLGKDRSLPTPPEGTGVVVYDTGAYGYAMSSNYNARTRPAEYLVDGTELSEIRRAESFEDTLRLFDSSAGE